MVLVHTSALRRGTFDLHNYAKLLLVIESDNILLALLQRLFCDAMLFYTFFSPIVWLFNFVLLVYSVSQQQQHVKYLSFHKFGILKGYKKA